MTQNAIQMARKTIAGIFTSETQEHIKYASAVERGRGCSFVSQESHCDLDIQTVDLDLKEREERKM